MKYAPLLHAVSTLVLAIALPLHAGQEDYLPGGPLAGLRLAGPYAKVGFELALYPGSVEVFSAGHGSVRSNFDQQTLLKNWVAPEIPGTAVPKAETYTPPVKRKWRENDITVIPCKVNAPVFQLDFGSLKPGLYAIRIIAAVAPQNIRPFREPLFIRMSVNDGLKGETSTYRVRIGYQDEFYSVAEIYFHAPEERAYQAEVCVDEGSKVDLLVHNITLDDVLAAATRRPIKTRSTLFGPADVARLQSTITEGEKKVQATRVPLGNDERLARDAIIWNVMPPVNAQPAQSGNGYFTEEVTIGADGMTRAQIEEKWGKWQDRNTDIKRDWDLWSKGTLLTNSKLGLTYTMDDLRAGRPLPGPQPFKADPAGIFTPDPKDLTRGQAWVPIAEEIAWRWRDYSGIAGHSADLFLKTGDTDYARDGAIGLIRWAYAWPALDASSAISCVTKLPGFSGTDPRFKQRLVGASFLSDYTYYLHSLTSYDKLFDYIKDNEELVKSVHRFIPSIQTPQDIIALLDTYLVQTTARRILRWQYISKSTGISECAAILGDNSFTDPWMDWLMANGLASNLSSSCDRNGTQYLGSVYYCQEDNGALQRVADMQPYFDAGGNQKYNLADPALYPKPLAQCRWQLGIMIGGFEFPRIGDVAGPDKQPGFTLPALQEASRFGWKWSADPKFAWLLKNIYGQKSETPAEWAKIEAAAETVNRAPWLDNRSRALANWCGILESGLDHDDTRFRRAVYVRAGVGSGHSHMDALDLQVVAHGLPMTVDGGQRSGYSKPNDRHFSRTHNTVEVDGKSFTGYSWVETLSDAEGARYMQIESAPPEGARLFRRQVALIDVDEGHGSQSLPIEKQKLDAVLEKGVVTATSYVFDVFRVAGGSLHTYCFHAMVNDAFETNVLQPKPVENVSPASAKDGHLLNDANYLSIFEASPESKFAGDAPQTLEATWRYTRDGKIGSEQQMLGPNFDEASPRKFTRLHLLDANGLRALRADTVSNKLGYRFTNLMAQRRGDNLETVSPAIIEPYAGEPLIAKTKLLPIAENETDALRAVAVEVQTTNGRTDTLFADGRPEKTRNVLDAQISGEFAYVSKDKDGLRQASLTGGTLLKAAGIEIKTAARDYTGTVVSVDYLKKTLGLDSSWPSVAAGKVFAIGTPEKMTSYTSTEIAPGKAGSLITVSSGADYYRAPIESVTPAGIVQCTIPMTFGALAGQDKNWIASNDDMTKFWRADVVNAKQFQLHGDSATESDLAPGGSLRLWEYGVGDTVRQSTFVSVRRVDENTYEVTGDVDVEITLKGKTHKLTAAEIGKDGVRLP